MLFARPIWSGVISNDCEKSRLITGKQIVMNMGTLLAKLSLIIKTAAKVSAAVYEYKLAITPIYNGFYINTFIPCFIINCDKIFIFYLFY